MRAVLDTNVAISAAINPKGPPAHIIKAWRAQSFTWVTSPALLAELANTFGRPRIRRYLAWSTDEVDRFLADAVRAATIVRPNETLEVIKRDPADNRVLEAAVAGTVDYIVSGDEDLLELSEHDGVQIVTAARFVAILSADVP